MGTQPAASMGYAPERQRVLNEISSLLHEVEAAVSAGADAEEICARLYAENLLVVGEGEPRATRGLAMFLPTLKTLLSETWAPKPKCRYILQYPVVVDENAASTLVELHVWPDEGRGELQIYRALYGWVRTASGWRVLLEMYGLGPV